MIPGTISHKQDRTRAAKRMVGLCMGFFLLLGGCLDTGGEREAPRLELQAGAAASVEEQPPLWEKETAALERADLLELFGLSVDRAAEVAGYGGYRQLLESLPDDAVNQTVLALPNGIRLRYSLYSASGTPHDFSLRGDFLDIEAGESFEAIRERWGGSETGYGYRSGDLDNKCYYMSVYDDEHGLKFDFYGAEERYEEVRIARVWRADPDLRGGWLDRPLSEWTGADLKQLLSTPLGEHETEQLTQGGLRYTFGNYWPQSLPFGTLAFAHWDTEEEVLASTPLFLCVGGAYGELGGFRLGGSLADVMEQFGEAQVHFYNLTPGWHRESWMAYLSYERDGLVYLFTSYTPHTLTQSDRSIPPDEARRLPVDEIYVFPAQRWEDVSLGGGQAFLDGSGRIQSGGMRFDGGWQALFERPLADWTEEDFLLLFAPDTRDDVAARTTLYVAEPWMSGTTVFQYSIPQGRIAYPDDAQTPAYLSLHGAYNELEGFRLGGTVADWIALHGEAPLLRTGEGWDPTRYYLARTTEKLVFLYLVDPYKLDDYAAPLTLEAARTIPIEEVWVLPRANPYTDSDGYLLQ